MARGWRMDRRKGGGAPTGRRRGSRSDRRSKGDHARGIGKDSGMKPSKLTTYVIVAYLAGSFFGVGQVLAMLGGVTGKVQKAAQ